MTLDDIEEFAQQVRNSVQSKETAPAPAVTGAPSGDWARALATASKWAQAGNSYFPVNEVVASLPPGAYKCNLNNQGPYLERMEVKIDHLLKLPDSATETLLSEFGNFWKLKPAFDARGFTFKRGMLMWGPPGSGKTSAIWQMAELLIKEHKGLLVFVEHPQVAIWCMNALRKIEPNRPLITVMEDIDALVHQYGEHHLLALLDGEFQLANVVHLATTNYPDRLDRRFVDRPSRFDTLMKVGMPSAAAREVYFRAKEPSLDEMTIARWVRQSEGYSVAHLREVCIATQCFNQDEAAVFKRLNRMRDLIKINDEGDEREQVGFLGKRRN